jgi:lipopolysaccharide biosynthesis protein/GT2 family glycosyltransferase
LDRIVDLPRFSLTRQKPSVIISRADRARDAGQWEVAAQLYRKALDRNPRNAAIWVQYGHALKESGELRDPDKLAQAEAAYRTALSLDPGVADTYVQLGHGLKLQGKTEEAQGAYLRAFALDPSSQFAQQELRGQGWSLTHLAELRRLTCPTSTPTAVGGSVAGAPGKRLSAASGGEPVPVHGERVGAFDGVHGTTAIGWVWDPRAPASRATVEFLVNGAVVHRAQANMYRDDVKRAGFGSGEAGFAVSLPIPIDGDSVAVHARLAGTNWALHGSPQITQEALAITKWMNRSTRVTGEFRLRLQARLDREAKGLLSIVMPIYNTDAEWLQEAIESVIGQWCGHWELICVNNGSTQAHVGKILEEHARDDNRIKVVTLSQNAGIAGGTNAGIKASSGELIALMDSDDYLEPDAVYKYLRAYQTSNADLLYCDELIAGSDLKSVLDVAARPAYSWDYYLSHPYFVHMICITRKLLDNVRGWNELMQQSGDIDFVLRCQEHAELVAHIPSVLYRWRTHATSAGHQMKEQVTPATLAALNRHLARTAPGAVATAGPSFNFYRIDFPDDRGNVLIVIQLSNNNLSLERCLESIWATTLSSEVDILIVYDETNKMESVKYIDAVRHKIIIFTHHGTSNHAKMINDAVNFYKERHGSLPPYVAFLESNVEAIAPGWLQHMRGLARRDDVGVVGATLLSADDTIQHSGVVIGLDGPAGHDHKFLPFRTDGERTKGHLGSLLCTRDYSAVTAACMMSRSRVFIEAGGFDEQLATGFDDTDYCLRVGSLGYKILKDAHAVLHHYESTRQALDPKDNELFARRWQKIIDDGDPYYSPLFSTKVPGHEIARYASASTKVTVKPGLAGEGSVQSSSVQSAFLDVRRWQTEVELQAPSVIPIDPPLGIFVHIFYDELADEIASYLAQIDLPKRIYVSTNPEEKKKRILSAFNKYGLDAVTQIVVVPNYGLDIAPLLVAFGDKLEKHDVCLKIHGKRSFQGPREFGDGWRSYLYHELMGDHARVLSIVNTMLANPDLGALIPQHYPRMHPNMISIGRNHDQMHRILSKIGIRLLPNQDIQYAVGSMFWFRGKALARLADLGFDWPDFGHSGDLRDGTLAHAMERCFLFFSCKAGMKWGFLPPFRIGPRMSRDEVIRLVRDSALFDEAYYLKVNPEVSNDGADPLEHWIDHGYREWRNPSENFDVEFYSRLMPPQYPNPLVHYIFEGWARGLPTVRPGGPFPFCDGDPPMKARGNGARFPSNPGRSAILDLRQWQSEVKLGPPSAVALDRPLGIFVHIFYDELTDEIASYLAQIDLPKRIYISTKPAEKKKGILAVFDRYGLGPVTEVVVVPDYGTDIGPFIIAFGDRLQQHDICLKIHSKRSFHAPRDYGDGWRSHLYQELMGDPARVRSIANTMLTNSGLGALIPRHYPRINPEEISIGVNYDQMQRILTKISIRLAPNQRIEYPVGSMFWFRGEALAALADLGFDWTDFGKGYEQTDGTLANGMERCFLFFVAKAGMKWGFLPPFRRGPAPISRETRQSVSFATPTSLTNDTRHNHKPG